MTKEDRRGADIVARSLEALGVTRIFALSGNHIMPIFDALLGTNIVIVHTRHEAACVHMADAWGRLTGEVGVALVTGGQGQTNGAAALFTALGGEAPVLLLSGAAPLRERGRGAFQELAQDDVARPMAKASWTMQAVEALGPELARAMRIAREGRPGPVHLALPVDLLEATIGDDATVPHPNDARPTIHPPAARLVADVADRLRKANRPVILVGPALCDTRGRALTHELQARSGVPVIAMESPRGIADPGLGCFGEILAATDLVVLVGKALDFTLRFAASPPFANDCAFVVIDPDEVIIARATRLLGSRLVASGIADARPTLAALADEPIGVTGAQAGWAGFVANALAYSPPAWNEARHGDGRVHPIDLCHAVDAFLQYHPGGTLVCDGGEIGQWPQSLVRAPRRLINGVAGTIGVSIPFAIAAKMAAPEEPVIAVLGDGAFGFHMAEFDTAVRCNTPFIAIVGNDARWNAEYQIQLRDYGAERAKHCDLLPTRYDEVVAALGGFGALVKTADALPAALEAAHASDLPACINVMIEGQPAPSIRRANIA